MDLLAIGMNHHNVVSDEDGDWHPEGYIKISERKKRGEKVYAALLRSLTPQLGMKMRLHSVSRLHACYISI